MAKPEAAGHIFQLLSTNGDGTGTTNANGDYRDAPTGAGAEEFYIQAPAGQVYKLARMIPYLRDTANWSADNYGDFAGALSVGFEFKKYDAAGVETLNLNGGQAIQANADWGHLCYDVDLISFGAGDDFMVVRWTFAKSGQPLTLNPGEKLSVTFNDNLTGLVEHTFMIQGLYHVL
jgi:hypothetical protein